MVSGLETKTKETSDSLLDVLLGKNYKISYKTLNSLNRPGASKGELIGGNLSMLYSLCGSKSSINTDGKILFIEDLDEYLYHIDRMIMNLKRNRSEEHTSELQSRPHLVCRLLLEKKKSTRR